MSKSLNHDRELVQLVAQQLSEDRANEERYHHAKKRNAIERREARQHKASARHAYLEIVQ